MVRARIETVLAKPCAASPTWRMRFPLRFSTVVRFAFGFFVAALALRAATSPSDKPNILPIIADQWRAQAFGYAGDSNVKTPHFDRFERESVNFTQAVSGTPVCT